MNTILLDLDGTLTDSAPGILASYHETLTKLGITPDPHFDMRFVIGPALKDVMPQVLAHYEDTRVEEALATYREIYGQTGWQNATLYDGAEDLVKSLANQGRPPILATAKRRDFAEKMLDRFNLSPHFQAIHGARPEGGLEHKQDLIAHILKTHHLNPTHCTMVGDRRYDITGAHANGVRAIGVLWGYGTREELEGAGAERLVRAFPDLHSALACSSAHQVKPRTVSDVKRAE